MFRNANTNAAGSNADVGGASSPAGAGAPGADPSSSLTPEEKLARVELVRDKTGVGFEEARSALEACGYDPLDAIVLLERQGKTARQTASYATSGSTAEAQAYEEMSQAQSDFESSTKPSGFTVACRRVLAWLKRALRRSVEIKFVVTRRGDVVLDVPLLLLVVLLVFAFWVLVPLLIVGLFLEFRYSFEGVGKVTVDVNEWSRKASDGVDHLKRDVMDGYDDAARRGGDGSGAGTDGR